MFFFNDTATTEIYTLSLHDALPICQLHPGTRRAPARAAAGQGVAQGGDPARRGRRRHAAGDRRRQPPGLPWPPRSEEHTSELQSRQYLVCRLLLEKKKKT